MQSWFHEFDVNTNCELKVRLRHVFRKIQTTCSMITGIDKECDNNRCLEVWRGFLINYVYTSLGKQLTACISIVLTTIGWLYNNYFNINILWINVCLQMLDVYNTIRKFLFLVIYSCMTNLKTFQGYKANLYDMCIYR